MVAFTELPPPPATRFGPVRLVAETGSTNADLLSWAADGEPEGSVLVTDHQRAGRGRQRRTWHDEPGNSLLVSVLLRPRSDMAPLLPLLTGLAAVDAVAAIAGGAGAVGDGKPRAGLKWPNDVLVPDFGERKLAGILAEAASTTSTPGSGTSDRLVVVSGMGMNLRSLRPPPVEISERIVTLSEIIGGPVDRDEVLGHFLTALERWVAEMESGAPVIEAYRRACLTIGREVRFASASGDYRGRAVDVSDRGTLVLETVDGERVELSAGDAHHL